MTLNADIDLDKCPNKAPVNVEMKVGIFFFEQLSMYTQYPDPAEAFRATTWSSPCHFLKRHRMLTHAMMQKKKKEGSCLTVNS